MNQCIDRSNKTYLLNNYSSSRLRTNCRVHGICGYIYSSTAGVVVARFCQRCRHLAAIQIRWCCGFAEKVYAKIGHGRSRLLYHRRLTVQSMWWRHWSNTKWLKTVQFIVVVEMRGRDGRASLFALPFIFLAWYDRVLLEDVRWWNVGVIIGS